MPPSNPSSLSISDENKPQLDHIQADFVTSAVLGVAPHHNHKAGDVRRLNGVIPRMNITPNPLAQDPTADKVRFIHILLLWSLHMLLYPRLFIYLQFKYNIYLCIYKTTTNKKKPFRWLVGQNLKRFLPCLNSTPPSTQISVVIYSLFY